MSERRSFADDVVAALERGKYIRVRAGSQHRFTGLWVVVVERRVFIRSWSLKENGWYRAFLEDPHGAILVEGREIPARAVRTRSERLKDAVSRAYAAKYVTRANLPYVKDMCGERSRDTTTELVPVPG